jgi:hypothetical protein
MYVPHHRNGIVSGRLAAADYKETGVDTNEVFFDGTGAKAPARIAVSLIIDENYHLSPETFLVLRDRVW